ncbi:unnamed protein product, partial [Protopolystoma xenopodis]
LLVVSTSVGGIPEVLPADLIRLASVDVSSIAACLADAIDEIRARRALFSTDTDAKMFQHSERLTNSTSNLPIFQTPADTSYLKHHIALDSEINEIDAVAFTEFPSYTDAEPKSSIDNNQIFEDESMGIAHEDVDIT